MQLATPVGSTRVYIDPPVFGQINPPAPAGRKTSYEYHEITAIVRELRMDGWDTRAIVVKRKFYTTGQTDDYFMAQPKNWGFITDVVQFMPYNKDYQPLKVEWVSGEVGSYWPEDLFMLHGGVTQTDLAKLFKRQMEK